MTRHDPPPAVPVPSAPATPANNEHPIDRLYRTLASNTLLAVVAAFLAFALFLMVVGMAPERRASDTAEKEPGHG